MVAGVVVTGAAAWLALDQIFGGAEDAFRAQHAALCRDQKVTRVYRRADEVAGYLHSFISLPPRRVREGRRQTTVRDSWQPGACVGWCARALVEDGFAFVEAREPVPVPKGAPPREELARYTLETWGHPGCIPLNGATTIDQESRAVLAKLARSKTQCLARAPISEPTARYEVRSKLAFERLRLGGLIVRVDTKVVERATNDVLAEQTHFLPFTLGTMTSGRYWPCRGPRDGGFADLLRPRDVLTPPKRAPPQALRRQP